VFPSLWEMLSATSFVQMSRFNFETIELVRSGFESWTAELRGSADRPNFHLVEVSFDALVDDEERAYMNALPTNLYLPDEDVDRLRSAGRRLLRESPRFQGALRAMGWPESASAPAPAPRTSADLR